MRYARIGEEKDKATKKVTAKVVEVFTPPKGFELKDCFTKEVAAQFVKCQPDVQVGWLYEDGKFNAP